MLFFSLTAFNPGFLSKDRKRRELKQKPRVKKATVDQKKKIPTLTLLYIEALHRWHRVSAHKRQANSLQTNVLDNIWTAPASGDRDGVWDSSNADFQRWAAERCQVKSGHTLPFKRNTKETFNASPLWDWPNNISLCCNPFCNQTLSVARSRQITNH